MWFRRINGVINLRGLKMLWRVDKIFFLVNGFFLNFIWNVNEFVCKFYCSFKFFWSGILFMIFKFIFFRFDVFFFGGNVLIIFLLLEVILWRCKFLLVNRVVCVFFIILIVFLGVVVESKLLFI